MDKRPLIALGLSEIEVNMFKAVLDAGEIPPAALAKAAGVKRTTAYSIAGSLVEKGLLVEDATRRPRMFRVASPEAILALAETEKRNLAEREESYKAFANELSMLSAGKSYPVPTVRFIEEEKIGQFLRQQTTEWDRSLLEVDPTWWGYLDHTFLEHHTDWLEWYWKQADEAIQVKLMTNRTKLEVEVKSQLEKIAGERRQTKYWGEVTNFLSSSWVVGDYLLMINTRTKPFYLIEIKDALMAHDQREVFKSIWSLVP